LSVEYDARITSSHNPERNQPVSDDRLILAIDQGTTSSRAMLVDRHGAVRASGQREFTQCYPRSGWVNHDAAEIWDVTLAVAREALTGSGVDVGRVAGLGITNQRETTVLWDRATGQPVAPAIVWQSRQSASFVNAIHARGMASRYQEVTGLVPDAYFSATKIAWLLEHEPGLRQRAEAGELAAGTIDSWLIWNLSGGTCHVTEYANASRTMLYDIRKLEWSQELLDDLSIPRSLLPEVRSNSEVYCQASSDLLGAEIPVAGVAGDQQSALFGQACFAPGEAKNTYGTGSFLLMQTGTRAISSGHNLLTTIAWGIDGVVEYALEGSIFVTGAAVQWLRDGLGIIRTASEVEGLAASVDNAGGVHVVPALTGLGAPHWDPDARGLITGISRGTTAAHIARATLEAIAWQGRDVLDAMQADSGIALEELRVDGGASRNDLLMQVQANVLGVPVVRPKQVETSVLGAAYLAGLAVGVWDDRDDVRESWEVDRRFEPQWSEEERDSRYAVWQDAVSRALTERPD
jgi:glycerol kinase